MQVWEEQAGSDASMIGCDAGAPPRVEALDGIRVEPAWKQRCRWQGHMLQQGSRHQGRPSPDGSGMLAMPSRLVE